MTMERSELLDNFEMTLQTGLVKVCQGAGLIGDEFMECPDINGRWDMFIKDYIADAVKNFNEYPEAAIAWSGFLGMAVANGWDSDWEKHCKDSYTSYYGSRGWDDMDEHILQDVLKLEQKQQEKVSDTLDSCALATIGLIRHQGIEAQTVNGFYTLARAYTVMFRIGAAIELQRLGYKKQLISTKI